jgi:hypothetical protein
MKLSIAASLFAACLLALCTGAAFAGNGHGGGHDSDGQSQAQGHDGDGGGGGWSHDQSSQQQSQPDQQQSQQQSQSQQQQQQQSSKHEDRRGGGSSRHDSDGSVQSGGSNDHGVKPDSTTKHDTYARADSDKTKQYGNGKTAGQIATSRGASGDTVLHGPGNSQPHKVVSCGHRHEVDVHAVKSYSSASCGEQSSKHDVAGASHEQKRDQSCAKTVTVTVPAGVWHDAGSRWVRSGSKHEGDVEVSESTTRTITISDACKRSEGAVREVAFQQAVPKCGHRVESVVKVQEQKPAAVAPAAVEQKKVYICHATGSSTNPYVLIHVSKHAEWAHTRHQDGRDIVLGETLTGSCPSAPPAPAAVAPAQQTQTQSCTTQQQVQVVVGVKHFIGPKDSGRYVIIHPNANSSHYDDKHPDELVYETRTISVAAPCPTTTPAAPAAVQEQQTTTTTAVAAQTETVVPPTQTTAAPAAPAAGGVLPAQTAQTAQSAPAATAPAQGGVLGAQATIAPKAKPASGGVLGTTGRIASSRLPFTGIELWIFALVAAALIAAGATLRRSGRGTL